MNYTNYSYGGVVILLGHRIRSHSRDNTTVDKAHEQHTVTYVEVTGYV